jgi:hypothetical protein
VVYAKASEGCLHISFPEVKAGQAILSAIAVAERDCNATLSKRELSFLSHTLKERTLNWLALDTDTVAKLPKEQLPQDSEARPASIYQPQPNSNKKGTTFVITQGLGQEYALRFRYKNTTGEAVNARMTITDSKHIVLVDREVSFPPTPPKFKMLSTTTGTQINAGTYTLRVYTDKVEFKELEVQ